MNKKNIIIVLGMHRSGTSAITKSLELLGVTLGDNLQPPNYDNPKGFWEDKSFLKINESLLKHYNSSYDRLNPVWSNLNEDKKVIKLKQKAVKLLTEKFKDTDIWGFKDPRTCRALPFWQSVFDEFDCKISYVIVSRHPISVVQSLEARNEIAKEKSFYLWLEHNLNALLYTEGTDRAIVDYDGFINNPYAELCRIAQAIDLDIPNKTSEAFIDFKTNFLDSTLRHTYFNKSDLKKFENVPKLVISTYDLLKKISKDNTLLHNEKTKKRILQLNADLQSHAPLFTHINTLEDQRVVLWKTISTQTEQLADERAVREAQIGQLSDELTARDTQIGQLNDELITRDTQIGQLSDELTERDTQIGQLSDELTTRDTQIGQLSDELTSRNIQLSQLQSERSAIFNSISWKLTKPYRFISTFLIKNPYQAFRKFGSDYSRNFWHKVPLPIALKLSIKHRLFNLMPFAFSWSEAYKNWQLLQPKNIAVNEASNVDSANESNAKNITRSHILYEPAIYDTPPSDKPAKLIAFYLPQFHTIPENDTWWGEGFTEWTNVKPAKPQFTGHYQPHIPEYLGYYDLSDTTTQKKQIELARNHGLEGFCFYSYWFGGKLLLEKPVENYLNDQSLDFPFCLCWANENWSRRWDGLDDDILIAQKHSASDDIAFIKHTAQFMKDERYIKVNGKPLLLVYRPSLLPSAVDTSKRWRKWCKENGIGDIYLAYTQSFETVDPANYGFDAAIEFPPNNSNPPVITDTLTPYDKNYAGIAYDWQVFVERSRNYKQLPYKLFRSVCPSWDNTARKKNKGAVFLNSTPNDYQEWLRNAINDTNKNAKNKDENLIFINAWNEWAEGAHLEPDQKYGYAYLNATRKALDNKKTESKILVVSHDAHPHGAQYLVLNLTKRLAQYFKLNVGVVCLGDGELKFEYEKYADLYELNDKKNLKSINKQVKKLVAAGYQHAIVNTAVSGIFLEALAAHGIKCISLIHEQKDVIEEYKLNKQIEKIAKHAHKVIFPTKSVSNDFQEIASLPKKKVVIRPQGLYKKNLQDKASAHKKLRKLLAIPKNAKVVLGVGYADHRKGVDLFVEAGKSLLNDNVKNTYFVWLGHWEASMQATIDNVLNQNESLKEHFIFPGRHEDTDVFYAGADVFALTSREDPFPSVVLEAMDATLPIVAFKGVGGCNELFKNGCGELVDAFDTRAFANAILNIIDNQALAEKMGNQGRTHIQENYNFNHYIFDLLNHLDFNIHRISVVVPNYNYAQYLQKRINSIENQGYPIYELIILDDKSTDDSINRIQKIINQSTTNIRLYPNDENSGSVFSQWRKGVVLSKGDLIWIAEADDLSEDYFLNTSLPAFDNPEVVMSYCESKQIDSSGNMITNNYHDYLSDICSKKWLNSYVQDGESEITEALSIKNTIPNVSAVLFRKSDLEEILELEKSKIESFSIAGDWYLYTRILKKGKIAFNNQTANLHRRHQNSVTLGALNQSQLEEVFSIQKVIASEYHLNEVQVQKAAQYIDTLGELFNVDTTKIASNLTDLAKSEAAVWEGSQYYNDAEQLTWVFWDDKQPFKSLFNKLDLSNVLELACGHGRHAEHLLKNNEKSVGHITLMDILDTNIHQANERLHGYKNVSFLKNNGINFEPIESSSMTAIYCYDAMVHFNSDVIASYLEDTYRVLSNGGMALYHHSNNAFENNPHFGMNTHARAYMPEGLFNKLAEQAGLKVIAQVVIPWGYRDPKLVPDLDCITLLEKSA